MKNILKKKIKILVDQFGYDISTYDFVIIENNQTSKIFLVKYSPIDLAFGFVTIDRQSKFYNLRELKGLFNNNFTITKIGSYI